MIDLSKTTYVDISQFAIAPEDFPSSRFAAIADQMLDKIAAVKHRIALLEMDQKKIDEKKGSKTFIVILTSLVFFGYVITRKEFERWLIPAIITNVVVLYKTIVPKSYIDRMTAKHNLYRHLTKLADSLKKLDLLIEIITSMKDLSSSPSASKLKVCLNKRIQLIGANNVIPSAEQIFSHFSDCVKIKSTLESLAKIESEDNTETENLWMKIDKSLGCQLNFFIFKGITVERPLKMTVFNPALSINSTLSKTPEQPMPTLPENVKVGKKIWSK